MTQHIKSFCTYTVGELKSLSQYEDIFSKILYRPCQGCEPITRGFVPMTDTSTILSLDGFDIGQIKVMQRTVPSYEVNIQYKERLAERETTENRKLEKNEKIALKIAIEQQLITQAFPKRTEVYFILDKVNHYLYVGATATSQVEHVIGLLHNVIPDFDIRPVITDIAPSDAITAFVRGFNDKFDELFIVGENIVIEDLGTSKIKWDGDKIANLSTIQDLLNSGKYVTSVGIKREDETISFKVDEYLHFSGLKYAKGYFDTEDSTEYGDLLLLASSIRDIFVDLTSLMKGDTEVQE